MHQIHLSIFVGFNLWLNCHDLYKYREVFSDFDPNAVSKLYEKKIDTPGSLASSLLSEVKLRAIIDNANQMCKVQTIIYCSSNFTILYHRLNMRCFGCFRNYWSFVWWGSYCILPSTFEKPSLPINLELHCYPRQTNEGEAAKILHFVYNSTRFLYVFHIM